MIDVPLPESIPFDGGRSGWVPCACRAALRRLHADYHPYGLISKSDELDDRKWTTRCDEEVSL